MVGSPPAVSLTDPGTRARVRERKASENTPAVGVGRYNGVGDEHTVTTGREHWRVGEPTHGL